MMLYRALVPDPAPARIDVPVLLLHGVLCNAGVWRRLTRFLAARGIPGVYSLSYGPPLASVELFADQMEAKIDAILAATGARQVMIVSHSMGGVVVRAYLRKYGPGKLARVLTIGAPHHGSVHAWLFFGTSLVAAAPGERMARGARARAAGPRVAIRVAVVVARLDDRAAALVAPRRRGRHADRRRRPQRAARRSADVRARTGRDRGGACSYQWIPCVSCANAICSGVSCCGSPSFRPCAAGESGNML